MNFENMTFEEIKQNDVDYIRDVLVNLKDKLEYDEYFGGWCIGEVPLRDYIYEEENTILNPKELECEMEIIIEDEFKIKKEQ